MALEAIEITQDAFSAIDPAEIQPGRCVYCGDRCGATATFHDYCRIEYENEKRYGSWKSVAEKRPRSPGEGDDTD